MFVHCERMPKLSKLLPSALFLFFLPVAGAETTTIEVKPMILPGADTFASHSKPASLAINLPLLNHLVLDAGDMAKLPLTLKVRRAPARLDVLAEGTDEKMDVDFGTEDALQEIRLEAGEAIAIAAWKSSWHYHGYADLKGLTVRGKTAGGKEFSETLPETFTDGTATVGIGRFELSGISNRDKFPVVSKTEKAVGKDGSYQLPSAKSARLGIESNGLRLNTQGKAGFKDAASDWAPALCFYASEDCTLSLGGTLQVRSGKGGQTMSYVVGRLMPAGPSLAGKSIVFESNGEQAAVHKFGDSPPEVAEITLDLAEPARKWLAEGQDEAELIAMVEPGTVVSFEKYSSAELEMVSHPKHVLFENGITPQPGIFAQHRDGKLYYGDKPLRLWSTVKDGSGERFRALGFNAVRVWFQEDFYNKESAVKGIAAGAVKGDGSKLDRFDRFMADLRENGLFVMFGTTIGRGMPTEALLRDDSWIAGGEDWKEWKAAVKKDDNPSFDYIDERLWKVRLRHAKNVLDHRNPYTGTRYAEEESIALIEINNERALIVRWLENGFDKWPEYFREKLEKKWSTWLLSKYKTDAALKNAWGKTGANESLAGGKFALSPTRSEMKKFPEQRGHDLVEFLIDLVDAKNREYVAHCRALAPAGTGSAVVPFSYDSQYKPSLPWLHSNALGDTSTVAMYFWGNGSSLNTPPKVYLLDSHSAADKLTVVYETGRSRPSPYRSEYPYMLAVLSAWQDFDVVSWHGNWMGTASPEQLLVGTAQPPTSHYWTGVHLEHDPTLSSSVALAGLLYRNASVEEAPDPIVFQMGKESSEGYRNWNGLTSTEMTALTFSRGTRIAFDTETSGGYLNPGGDPREAVTETKQAVRTGENVLWDWKNGALIIDSPSAKAYIGSAIPSYQFKGGITLSGLGTEWIAFCMASADGKPLLGENATKRALISAVHSSANTGFDYDWSVSGNPADMAKAVKNPGHAPVLTDRVPYTLSFPEGFSGSWNTYDFAMRKTSGTALTDRNTIRHRGETPWMAEIVFDRRDGKREVETDAMSALEKNGTEESTGEKPSASLAGIANPVSGLSWADTFARSLELLQKDNPSANAVEGKRIELPELKGIFEAPVQAEIVFKEGRMREILFTLKQGSEFGEIVKTLTGKYGDPTSKKIAKEAYDESRVTWTHGGQGITATEVQGVIRISHVLE